MLKVSGVFDLKSLCQLSTLNQVTFSEKQYPFAPYTDQQVYLFYR